MDLADSPYSDLDRRIRDLYAQATAGGGHPSVVAEAIENAVTTSTPKLRYLVGADAETFAGGRSRLTDEEYQTLGDKQTDEEWWALFAKMFPRPDRRRVSCSGVSFSEQVVANPVDHHVELDIAVLNSHVPSLVTASARKKLHSSSRR